MIDSDGMPAVRRAQWLCDVCMQNLIRDGKDNDSGASLALPKPQNYSALDIWAYDSAGELKV